MGGTLDLSTFFLPLRHLGPCTFNAALDMRTHVRILPYSKGKIKISSLGFADIATNSRDLPFNGPMGFMLAVCAYFNADGVHIEITSNSPPRSALGGSSVAAVALIWALSKAYAKSGHPMIEPKEAAMLAHAIEQSIAGVPCGMQDHLAAAYGGVNAWHWKGGFGPQPIMRELLVPIEKSVAFSRRILVAYCGEPHHSSDINGTWVQDFLAGKYRSIWAEIVKCTQQFIRAVADEDYRLAHQAMNRETELRCEMTPHVLDDMGRRLVDATIQHGCGARFAGAGGGGCVWALGDPEKIATLKNLWQQLLSSRPEGKVLETSVDTTGVL
jgi:D-glycero-alpha-D-manno-heptose-7-phosphate kinase